MILLICDAILILAINSPCHLTCLVIQLFLIQQLDLPFYKIILYFNNKNQNEVENLDKNKNNSMI